MYNHSQQLNPSKQEPMTVDTIKKVNKPVVAEAQVINNYVSDVVKAMDMQTNVLQGR